MDAATIGFAILQAATLFLILALLYRPLGDYIARTYTRLATSRSSGLPTG